MSGLKRGHPKYAEDKGEWAPSNATAKPMRAPIYGNQASQRTSTWLSDRLDRIEGLLSDLVGALYSNEDLPEEISGQEGS